MKKVCLYVRVSHTSGSVQRQIRELTDIAGRNNWEIVETYIDKGISGAKGRDKRPALDKMMKDSITRKFELVMISSIDRLGRSLQHLIEIVNDFQSKSVDLFVLAQSIDTTVPSGKLLFSMVASFAEYERSIIRERILSGLENAKAKGKVLGRKTNLDASTERKILSMKDSGSSIRVIASECSVSNQTIYKVLRAA
jgi:DNA invertase Pin-like site-specific DNA recombinase